MAWRRTVEAMQKIPRLKMRMRASFSRLGRCTLRRVVMGKTRIQISIAMLREPVTALCERSRPGIRLQRHTIEQRCGVDTLPLHRPREVPHLVQRDTLRQGAYHTYDTEGGQKIYGAFAELLELSCRS